VGTALPRASAHNVAQRLFDWLQVRAVLAENSFKYDSTLIVAGGDFGNRIWPWDMGSGIASETDCDMGE